MRLEEIDLRSEEWREYEFGDRVYRIVSPRTLYYRPVGIGYPIGGTTHRVLDAQGLVHCVPAPGFHGCVLRWKPRHGQAAVVS